MKIRWLLILFAVACVSLGVLIVLSPIAPETVQMQARSLVRQKKYEPAIVKYESIADWMRKDPERAVEWARAYAYADRHIEAIALFEEVVSKYPDHAKKISQELGDAKAFAVLIHARQLVEKKQYAEAIKEYDSIAKWLERDPGLLIERARVYAYADRNDDAILLLEGISAKYPDRAVEIAKELADQKSFVALGRARRLVESKQFVEAIREYDSLAKWLERDPGLLIERARIYAYANRHNEAIALYEDIIRSYPAQKSALEREMSEQGDFVELELARALVEKKDYERAIPLYGQIAALLDRDPGLWIELARVYSYANKHGKAAEIYERIRQQYPDYKPSFLRELGDAYAWQNKLDDAVRIYRLALEEKPDDPDAAVGLARTLGWSGKRREALAIYDAALVKHPESAKLLVGKADIVSMMDRFSEAWRLLDRVTQKEPGNLDALNMKARLMVWDGYHRRGADMYRKILEMTPDNPDALEGLAFALYWDEREAESVKVLERLLVLQPNRKEAAGLMYRVRRANNPDVTMLGEYFSDSDHRDVWRAGFFGGIIPIYGTRLEAQVDTASITSDRAAATNEVGAYGIGVSIDAHLGEQFRLKVPVRGTYYDKNGWDVWTTDSSLLWQPVDAWFFEGGYEHAVIEKVATILDELTINNVKGRIKWKPDRLWMFSCALNHGDYSDGNRQDALMGIAEYRITQDPYSKIYYNYYFSDWDNEAADYFSPARFSAHTLGLYLSSMIAPSFFVEGQGSGGYETQVRRSGPEVNAVNIFFAGGLVYRPSESWRLSLRCEYFESFADSSSNYDGYRSLMGRLGITYLFGGGLEREQLSTETAPSPSPRNR